MSGRARGGEGGGEGKGEGREGKGEGDMKSGLVSHFVTTYSSFVYSTVSLNNVFQTHSNKMAASVLKLAI